MAELPAHIENEIETMAAAEGLELVHIDYRRMGKRFLLRVDVDKEGGVTIDDCAELSHQVSAYLDVEDVVPGEYELQVSSPGLDRQFYRESDYEKFLGRLVRVKTAVAVRGLHVIVGRLASFDGEKIIVIDPKSRNQNEYEISLGDIREARLEVEI
ncbi:MAG TPA: ribosome maturation factor RimP [Thermoanaerobaculia bacterium]|nr:ribosome maturation factor RimP [Thermoanaerobaculia bacterium]